MDDVRVGVVVGTDEWSGGVVKGNLSGEWCALAVHNSAGSPEGRVAGVDYADAAGREGDGVEAGGGADGGAGRLIWEAFNGCPFNK